jgi:dehydrogenase/reductase SDR family protein 7B
MHFKDKVVWITGASSGIGAELAGKLAKQKAWLILTGRNIEALKTIQGQCLLHTGKCEVLPADLLIPTEIVGVTTNALSVYGKLDIVIFSAGVTQRSLTYETVLNVDRQLMEINFFGPVAITKQLLPQFARQRSGHIIAIGSMAGLMGFPLRSAYSAAKHALTGFFETLQAEHTVPGLNITIVSPGRINTAISLSALTANGLPHGQMDEGQLNGIPVSDCADNIIAGIIKKKKHIIIARGERVLYWIWWFVPSLYYKIARRTGLK